MLRFVKRSAMSGAVLALSFGCATSVQAQQRIGEAAAVQNQVTRVSASGTSGLSAGGAVFRAETIRTAAASSARLVFLDNTNLSVGPASSVVLNQFVYSGGGTARAVGINLARGAFRFSTGESDKSAYKINTPVATIGVRGTVLDIRSQGGTTDVTMVDNGEALVCSIAARSCLTLSGPGNSVRVTSAGVSRVIAGRGFSFAGFCGGNICGGGTRFAGGTTIVNDGTLVVPVDAGNDLLCGR